MDVTSFASALHDYVFKCCRCNRLYGVSVKYNIIIYNLFNYIIYVYICVYIFITRDTSESITRIFNPASSLNSMQKYDEGSKYNHGPLSSQRER